MIDPERKIKINGHDIEEYLWRGELLVYINGLLFNGTYEEAQRKCWEDNYESFNRKSGRNTG